MLFHRAAVFDVMRKLITEMLGKAADREDGGIGKGADGAACHLVADRIQQIQVFHAAFAFYDAADDAVKPAIPSRQGVHLPQDSS